MHTMMDRVQPPQEAHAVALVVDHRHAGIGDDDREQYCTPIGKDDG